MFKTTLPIFFPSISSVKTDFEEVINYMQVLIACPEICPQFLISAYDLNHMSKNNKDKSLHLLNKAKESGTIILMDSGNYESYWKDDRKWEM